MKLATAGVVGSLCRTIWFEIFESIRHCRGLTIPSPDSIIGLRLDQRSRRAPRCAVYVVNGTVGRVLTEEQTRTVDGLVRVVENMNDEFGVSDVLDAKDWV